MAENKSLLALILLALIILWQGFECIEGRNVKDEMQSVISTTNVAVGVSPPTPPTGDVSPPGRDVDNFRPTAPGHSPGVGHSAHN
ncbi:Precursor of CEP5, partial [Mucuna pruriens]